jgi:aminoglycoside phosphotransferase (APT) family kinase protein
MQAESGCTVVVVAYKPKPGKEADLLQLTREHVPLLRAEGLATARPVTACQAKDGTVVEVFEWVEGGVQRAHTNPVVHKLWERYAAACDIVPLASLPEASNMFASFTPLDL